MEGKRRRQLLSLQRSSYLLVHTRSHTLHSPSQSAWIRRDSDAHMSHPRVINKHLTSMYTNPSSQSHSMNHFRAVEKLFHHKSLDHISSTNRKKQIKQQRQNDC